MLPVIYRNFIRISGVRGEGKKKREEQCLTFFEFTTRLIIPLLLGGEKNRRIKMDRPRIKIL